MVAATTNDREPALSAAHASLDSGPLEVRPRVVRRIASRFSAACARGLFPGGQLVIRRRGELVLNLAVGTADPTFRDKAARVTPQTTFPVFSAGFPLFTVCVMVLEARGLLDPTIPLSRWLPEFSEPGKERATTDDVLRHRLAFPLDAASDPGWILSRVIETFGGVSLPDFVATEIAGPLELPMLRVGPPEPEAAQWLDGSLPLDPALTVTTDADSLAQLYAMLVAGGVDSKGRRFLPERSVQAYTSRDRRVDLRDVRAPFVTGRGFMFPSPSSALRSGAAACFGYAGGSSALAYGDPRAHLAFAAATNGAFGPLDFAALFLSLAGLARSAVSR